ncbi:hypothetical protein [Neisseria leonii]|uniref:hypothetical protein n=1 Tax=Neisseria leonii TaxID=2995413 RepID=UPI00237BFCCF|nr:hypothetical protein [Neisseria sp. 3986]MDD9325832.1 hypothetical protein [Neisseria sp. 3986]
MDIALLCFGVGSIASISGTEKVFVDMANAMTVRGHRVYAVWNDEPGVVPHYPFSADVRQYNLGLGKIRIPLSAKLMREVEKRLRIYRMNPADAFKVRQLAAAVRENVPLNEIDVFVCFEFNSVMVANRLAGGAAGSRDGAQFRRQPNRAADPVAAAGGG